jgi:hypothetical protein
MGVTLWWPTGSALIYARDTYPYDITAENVFEDPYVTKTIYATKIGYTGDSKFVEVRDLDNVETDIEVYTYKDGHPEEIVGAFVRIKSIRYWERYTGITGSDGKCMLYDFLPDTDPLVVLFGGRFYAFKATHDDYKPKVKVEQITPGPPEPKNIHIKMKPKSGGGGNDCDVDIETYDFDEDLQIHTFEFVATPSQGDPSQLSSYSWDFGDGHQELTVDNTIIHEYPEAPAEYTIRVDAIYPDDTVERGELDLEIAPHV